MRELSIEKTTGGSAKWTDDFYIYPPVCCLGKLEVLEMERESWKVVTEIVILVGFKGNFDSKMFRADSGKTVDR